MSQKLYNSQYDTFSATRTHSHSNGLSMMPTAGPFPQPAQVVALHGGLDFDIIVYIASRRGEPPVVPSPVTRNPNRIFLAGGRAGDFPITDIGGVTNYTIGGWLLFGIISPEGLASNFMLGNLPFPGVDPNEYIPNYYFSYALINQTLTQTLVPVPPKPPLLSGISLRG